ncbi:MAG: hypothetical protein J6S49_02215 [Erysipelotrichaceae bacterium]|nr:hypothetical protein [Erysipelotrichaceae bacterium]
MKYLETIKAILNSYADKVRKNVDFMNQARRTYQPAIADKEVAAALQNIYNDSRAAQQEVDTAAAKETEAVKAWSVLYGSDINNNDLALLSDQFDLTGEDLANLVNRYRNNSAMLRAIETYYRKRQAGQTREAILTDQMYLPQIPTAENKIIAVNHFAEAAKSLIKQIEAAPDSLTKFTDREAYKEASSMDMLVAGFGEPGISNRKDLFVLGY